MVSLKTKVRRFFARNERFFWKKCNFTGGKAGLFEEKQAVSNRKRFVLGVFRGAIIQIHDEIDKNSGKCSDKHNGKSRAIALQMDWFWGDVKDEKIWEYKEMNTTSQFLCACRKVLTISLGYWFLPAR